MAHHGPSGPVKVLLAGVALSRSTTCSQVPHGSGLKGASLSIIRLIPGKAQVTEQGITSGCSVAYSVQAPLACRTGPLLRTHLVPLALPPPVPRAPSSHCSYRTVGSAFVQATCSVTLAKRVRTGSLPPSDGYNGCWPHAPRSRGAITAAPLNGRLQTRLLVTRANGRDLPGAIKGRSVPSLQRPPTKGSERERERERSSELAKGHRCPSVYTLRPGLPSAANTSCPLVATRTEIAHRLRSIKRNLDGINQRKAKLSLVQHSDGGSNESDLATRRETSSLEDKERPMIGRNEFKTQIREALLNSSRASSQGPCSKLWIACIVGIGGMGKTTIAQNIFNDKDVK
ncbi:hypothetical protein Taro_054031, partial [Colocasia esculenta]|nr:hypothetical protein [Colocasia esculenta]